MFVHAKGHVSGWRSLKAMETQARAHREVAKAIQSGKLKADDARIKRRLGLAKTRGATQ